MVKFKIFSPPKNEKDGTPTKNKSSEKRQRRRQKLRDAIKALSPRRRKKMFNFKEGSDSFEYDSSDSFNSSDYSLSFNSDDEEEEERGDAEDSTSESDCTSDDDEDNFDQSSSFDTDSDDDETVGSEDAETKTSSLLPLTMPTVPIPTVPTVNVDIDVDAIKCTMTNQVQSLQKALQSTKESLAQNISTTSTHFDKGVKDAKETVSVWGEYSQDVFTVWQSNASSTMDLARRKGNEVYEGVAETVWNEQAEVKNAMKRQQNKDKMGERDENIDSNISSNSGSDVTLKDIIVDDDDYTNGEQDMHMISSEEDSMEEKSSCEMVSILGGSSVLVHFETEELNLMSQPTKTLSPEEISRSVFKPKSRRKSKSNSKVGSHRRAKSHDNSTHSTCQSSQLTRVSVPCNNNGPSTLFVERVSPTTIAKLAPPKSTRSSTRKYFHHRARSEGNVLAFTSAAASNNAKSTSQNDDKGLAMNELVPSVFRRLPSTQNKNAMQLSKGKRKCKKAKSGRKGNRNQQMPPDWSQFAIAFMDDEEKKHLKAKTIADDGVGTGSLELAKEEIAQLGLMLAEKGKIEKNKHIQQQKYDVLSSQARDHNEFVTKGKVECQDIRDDIEPIDEILGDINVTQASSTPKRYQDGQARVPKETIRTNGPDFKLMGTLKKVEKDHEMDEILGKFSNERFSTNRDSSQVKVEKSIHSSEHEIAELDDIWGDIDIPLSFSNERISTNQNSSQVKVEDSIHSSENGIAELDDIWGDIDIPLCTKANKKINALSTKSAPEKNSRAMLLQNAPRAPKSKVLQVKTINSQTPRLVCANKHSRKVATSSLDTVFESTVHEDHEHEDHEQCTPMTSNTTAMSGQVSDAEAFHFDWEPFEQGGETDENADKLSLLSNVVSPRRYRKAKLSSIGRRLASPRYG